MPASFLSTPVRRERYAPISQPIHLLISDESSMGCQLLRNGLARPRSQFQVVACAVTMSEIISSMNSHHVDVALVSENLRDGLFTGFRVLGELRTSFPKVRSILLLKAARHDLVVDAFRAGAKGVFCREEPIQALWKCIQTVYEGQVWANSIQLHYVLDAFVSATPLRVVSSQGYRLLAKREDEVVHLVVDGLSNRKVAEKLGITEHTVSNYLFRIYEKLGISSRVELVLYALRQTQQS